jgi:hypothetical protein
MPDRAFWLVPGAPDLNVRRLMYQSLIWAAVLPDDARRLVAPLDAEDVKRLADPLVYGVRRDVEGGGNFLGRQVFVDEPQAVELPGAQACDALSHDIIPSSEVVRSLRGGNHVSLFLQRKH